MNLKKGLGSIYQRGDVWWISYYKNSKQFRDLSEMMIKARDTLLEIEPKKDPDGASPKAAFVSINIHND